MERFTNKHQEKIHGVISCFDRMLFRGYLPIENPWTMAAFLNQNCQFKDLKSFLLSAAERIKDQARSIANKYQRPIIYLRSPANKEKWAYEMAEKNKITEGLICIFSQVEPCRSFSFKFEKGMQSCHRAKRKGLVIYYYFMDKEFGLIHIKIQTWFPLRMQFYCNGHEWLAKKLTEHKIRFTKCDNAFLWIEDLKRAQKFSDRFHSLDWPGILTRFAKRINPLMKDLLKDMNYFWVTAQSEYSTDILFKTPNDLKELYEKLISHSTMYFGAKEVMSFLGKKLHGCFQGEIGTDLTDRLKKRLPGVRIKHRVKGNWIKMYDKAGSVLRIEMVINQPEEYRIRRKTCVEGGKKILRWVGLRKGVAYLFRYRDVSLAANRRYLDALAVIQDPSPTIKLLDTATTRQTSQSGRGAKAINPLSKEDSELFTALMNGSHCIHGFKNSDIREALQNTEQLKRFDTPKKASAKISRVLARFHTHGLIAKIPRSRKWKVSMLGYRLMATSIKIRKVEFPTKIQQMAA